MAKKLTKKDVNSNSERLEGRVFFLVSKFWKVRISFREEDSAKDDPGVPFC